MEQPQPPAPAAKKPKAPELPKEGPGSFSFWQGEVTRSENWLKSIATLRKWDENLQSYLTLVKNKDQNEVVVPKDYANVENKKALLFFQVPEVTLTAEQPGIEGAVKTFQAVINRKLRSDDVNAAAMMDEVLFDALCPAGFGVCKIGYEPEVDGEIDVEIPQMGPDGAQAIDPMTGKPAMTVEQAPNVVNEKYFMSRLSPKNALIPADFHGKDFDRAAWLGHKFEADLDVVVKTLGLTPEQADELKASKGNADDSRIKGDIKAESSGQKVCGYEIYYRAAQFHKDVKNSDLFWQLVWFDGQDAPAIVRPSPYQKVENGKLVGGMRGNPIHVLTLRYVSDMAIPPSDVFVSRELVDSIGEGRTDMVAQRRANKPINGYDPSRLPTDAVQKIVDGVYQEWVPIPGFNGSDQAAGELRKANFPRENFTFNDYLDRDIQEVWAMGANQQGLQTKKGQTATEASIQQTATQTRMKREQVEVARFFVSAVQKFAALIQLFADDQDYVEIVGQDGTRALQQWDKTTIQGRFAFSAKPDSSLQIDAAWDKKQAMEEYSFLRQDPLVNPQYLLQRLAQRLGMEPTQLIAQPQPAKPEPPKESVAFKGDDLNPMMPQFAIVLEILKQQGITISPEAEQNARAMAAKVADVEAAGAAADTENANQQAQLKHGGTSPQVAPLNKHAADQSGMLPGAGTGTPSQGIM